MGCFSADVRSVQQLQLRFLEQIKLIEEGSVSFAGHEELEFHPCTCKVIHGLLNLAFWEEAEQIQL